MRSPNAKSVNAISSLHGRTSAKTGYVVCTADRVTGAGKYYNRC